MATTYWIYFGSFLPGFGNIVLSKSYIWTYGKKHQGTQKKRFHVFRNLQKGPEFYSLT